MIVLDTNVVFELELINPFSDMAAVDERERLKALDMASTEAVKGDGKA